MNGSPLILALSEGATIKKYLLFQTDQPYKVVPPPVTAEGFINNSNYRYIMIS